MLVGEREVDATVINAKNKPLLFSLPKGLLSIASWKQAGPQSQVKETA